MTPAARRPTPGRRAQVLFETLGEDELVDPGVAPQTLLYRLFHEDGVRLFPPRRLHAYCRCSQDRVLGMLKSFPAAELADMVEPDGAIHVHLRILLPRLRRDAGSDRRIGAPVRRALRAPPRPGISWRQGRHSSAGRAAHL